MTNPRTPWTPAENAALVSLYFAMLDRAIKAQPYNKAAMIRKAQNGDFDGLVSDNMNGPLALRSRGSIEAKLMNASAAHADLLTAGGKSTDGPHQTMAAHGYKAWGNYQASLKQAMADALEQREGISLQAGGSA